MLTGMSFLDVDSIEDFNIQSFLYRIEILLIFV
jgi:hypothetical protein